MAKLRNHYDVLEVTSTAPDFVIKAAYKALCQTYHPDKFQGSKEEADRRMKLINAAYAELIDPIKRATYDRLLEEQEANAQKKFYDFEEPPEQNYQQRQDKPYNPKPEEPSQSTNSENRSKPITSCWLRFFARIFDVWWETLLISIVLFTFKYQNPTHFVYWFSDIPISDVSLWLICIPLALVSDAILYRFFGNTPGKAWLGLTVKTDASLPLGFFQYLGRNLKIYVSGLAFGLPLIGFFPMYYQSIRLRKGLQASYDESTGFRVYEQPVSWILKTSFGIAFAFLFIVLSVLNIMEKKAQQTSTLSTNLETPANLTPKPEHQSNSAKEIAHRANELYEQGRYAEAIPLYELLAKSNDANVQNSFGVTYASSAQVSLGWFYMNGLGNLPKDYKQAAYWNQLGATNGDPEGANNLGWQYEHGFGVAQDFNKATELYQYAINRGMEIGVEKERIEEAKSRLANLSQLRQLNTLSDKKVVITETNDTLRVIIDNEKKFEIKGNLPRLKKEMSESRLSPIHRYEFNDEKKPINRECIIKPVMTKVDIENCKN
ncbi:MAG: DnaJ domain-containing protein [Methyloglobulus sp.]|nr:DnaJ domain-containing protein [Methyloglobulus sp.]